MPRSALTGFAGSLAVGLALALTASAGAAQFCVHHAGCSPPSTNFTTIQGALSHAASASGPDTILVGPGTYDGPFSDDSGNVVTLVGSGNATVLDDPGTGDSRTTLTIAESQSSFSAFAVLVPSGTSETGINTSGAVDRVTVTAPAENGASAGVAIGGAATVDHTTISGASTGAFLSGGRLRRSRVSAPSVPVDSQSGEVENSLLRLTQAGGSGIAVGTTGIGTVDAHQVTLIGPNDADSRGVAVNPQVPAAGGHANANLDGVVIRGFGHALSAVPGSYPCGTFMFCANPATITISYSDWDPSNDVGNTNGANDKITTGSGDIHALPRFRNPAASDYRLQHTSPLIDASDPAAPLFPDSTLDVNDAPRKVDGNRDGNAVVDIGAFEVQPFFGLKTLLTLKLGASKIPAAGPMPVVVSNLNNFPVNGTVTGQTAGKIPVGKHKKRHVALKPQAFSVGGHRSTTLSFALPQPVIKQLAKKGKLTFALVAIVHDPDGDVRTVPVGLTAHTKHKKKKH